MVSHNYSGVQGHHREDHDQKDSKKGHEEAPFDRGMDES